MSLSTTGQIYVAIVKIPLNVHGVPSVKNPQIISGEGYFGISRGYWHVYLGEDSIGNPRPDGVLATIELAAPDRIAAEDAALVFARRFGTLLGFNSGSPRYAPEIVRLAVVGDSGGLVEQSEYIYEDAGHMFGRVELSPSWIALMASRMESLPNEIRGRVERGQSWYRASISSDEPLDAYVAAWIGFEGIGPRLSEVLHPKGPNTECNVCVLQAPGRQKAQSAFEHMAILFAPEILDSTGWQALGLLRNNIVHCRKSEDQLTEKAEAVLKEFQLVLASGVLTLMAKSVSNQSLTGGWPAYLPRVVEERPDRRFWIQYNQELTDLQPYLGGWSSLEWDWVNESSEIRPNGHYIWGAGATTGWGTKTKVSDWNISDKGCEIYERFGTTWQERELDAEGVVGQCIETAWHNETLPPSWLRLKELAQGKSAQAPLS